MAELSSMMPGPGGPYQWTLELAPPHHHQLLAYLSGCLSAVGWQARFTALCCIIAGIVLAMIEVNDGHYEATGWQRNLLTILIAAVISGFNAVAAGHLSLAEGVFAICHVYALVPIVVFLWVLAPKHSVATVFAELEPSHSWPSSSLAVLVGQLPSICTLLGSEAVIHIAEEIEEPDIILPRCILWGFLANIPGTVLLLLTFAFNSGPVERFKNATMPFVADFNHIFQSTKATLGLSSVVLSLMLMVAVSTMVATSRQLFTLGQVPVTFE